MRRLVCHDIMGKACIKRLAATSHEIPEEDAAILTRVKGIRVGEGVRGDVQLMPIRTPGTAASQCKLELGESPHRNGINVLSMKARIFEQLSIPPLSCGC